MFQVLDIGFQVVPAMAWAVSCWPPSLLQTRGDGLETARLPAHSPTLHRFRLQGFGNRIQVFGFSGMGLSVSPARRARQPSLPHPRAQLPARSLDPHGFGVQGLVFWVLNSGFGGVPVMAWAVSC